MSSDSDGDDWSISDSDDVQVQMNDLSTSTLSDDRKILCEFCRRKIHDLEEPVALKNCGHNLCVNCVEFLKNYPGRQNLCPICLKSTTTLAKL